MAAAKTTTPPDVPEADSAEDVTATTAQAVGNARERKAIDGKAKDAYGKTRGISGKRLDDAWAQIPDGLREAYRIQVRPSK